MSADSAPIIIWFRFDLRLADNPALAAAAASGRPVVPVYLLDDDSPGRWRLGGAARWWLAGSLDALGGELGRLGSRLILRRGKAGEVLPALIAETGAGELVCNRVHEPWAKQRDDRVAAMLAGVGVRFLSFEASLLFPPEIMPGPKGQGYRVFTPFWRACCARPSPEAPMPAPKRLLAPAMWPASDSLAMWALRPTAPDWAAGLREAWTPGETGARRRLDAFLGDGLARYGARRDRPDLDGVSCLSPHLRFGEIGPRQVWHAVAAGEAAGEGGNGARAFLRQLVWREFSYNLLNYFEDIPDKPMQEKFGRFPWREEPALLAAWRRGRTGYPIVDAGMRQLWATAWMHNRVRMIVASFLVKHLLLPWQAGEAWFWDTLVDADLANNAANWQWVAGCGADASPYFRIFNPMLQGEKFDPGGAYVRRWVPELAALPSSLIHAPWKARPIELASAGVRLGENYPKPVVDHGGARARALAAFAAMKAGG